jgi:hypothetical protein
MARIWPVYEGREPTVGEPWASLPLAEAVHLFELRPEDYISGPRDTSPIGPRFGDYSRDLRHAGYKHVVVEIDPEEARKSKWKQGFYKARVEPEEVFRRLLQQAMASGLGRGNVVGLEFEPSTDSRGEDALKIYVVIAPGAVRKLKGSRALDALVKLRERLDEMHDERTPLVQYVTEAELDEVAGR